LVDSRYKLREETLEGFAQRAVSFCRVKPLKIVAASALLVIWIPATSLCLAENAGIVAADDHCSDRPSSQTSPCCALASAAYKLDDNDSAVAPLFGVMRVWLSDLADVSLPAKHVELIDSGVSPPELLKSWQFRSRAAGRPRAPSFAS
jgi:hypothetical protein